MKPFLLPKDFLLGCATSGAQVDGGDKNSNWYLWAKAGHIKDKSDILRADDHWNRYREDIAIMAQMHQQVYRMGIEWSRIEPEKGKFDEAALLHYREILKRLNENHIRPLLTLFHFTYPAWLEKEGGFENRGCVSYFKRYVRHVVEALGDLVSEYVTINEPNVLVFDGYVIGLWPPGKKNILRAYKVFVNLSFCHMAAYRIIHDVRDKRRFPGKTMVGVAHHVRIFDPFRRGNAMDAFLAEKEKFFFQESFMDYMTNGTILPPAGRFVPHGREGHYADFLGLNYYSRNMVNALDVRQFVKEGRPVNDLGWEIYPDGLHLLCKECWEKYHLPIWITENGVCDNNDVLRAQFIAAHLSAVAKAIDEGAHVERYYHWSLLDNFEWIEGESARFGLVHVDYETQKRTVKNSGRFYAEICADHGCSRELLQKYHL